jgi:hypothetical protein
VLVALKCDLRERHQEDEDTAEAEREPKRPMIEYKQGLNVAQKIKALRYLGGCAEERGDMWWQELTFGNRMLSYEKPRRQ